MHTAKYFIDHWIISYGIQTYLLSDNGQLFVSRFFLAIDSFLSTEQLILTDITPKQTVKLNSAVEQW